MKTYTVSFEKRVEHTESYHQVIKAETHEAALEEVKKLLEDGELIPESSVWSEDIETLENEDYYVEEQ